LDQLLDQPVRAVEVDLARIDPREQIIHHPRLGQTPRALLLSLPTRLTRHLVDHQLCASFHKETHPLHTPFDTPQSPDQVTEVGRTVPAALPGADNSTEEHRCSG